MACCIGKFRIVGSLNFSGKRDKKEACLVETSHIGMMNASVHRFCSDEKGRGFGFRVSGWNVRIVFGQGCRVSKLKMFQMATFLT